MGNESKSLWISMGAGLMAAFLMYSYSQEKKAEFDKQYGSLKTVVRAKQNISEMQTIDETMLEVTERPADYVDNNMINKPDYAIGQVAAIPITAGEIISENKLLPIGPETGIGLAVAPRKRAVTIPVDDVRSVAKLIRPGDRVDIFAAIDIGKGATARREVTLLLSDVAILATGTTMANQLPRKFESDGTGKSVLIQSMIGDTKYSTLTIEVTPKEAQDLVYLLSTSPANIYFTMRNPNDREALPRMPTSTSESLLGKPAESAAPPAGR